MKMVVSESIRAHELDGIRGWAALNVVLFHIFVESFGIVFPEFSSPYVKSTLDGDLAVCIFFILSGDALAIPFFRARNFGDMVPTIVNRYFRLAVPILVSCLVVYLLMKSSLVYNVDAAALLNRSDWLGSWLQFEPNILRMFRFALSEVFGSVDGKSSYNPFLWTMSYELFGSFLIFGLCASYNYLRNQQSLCLFAGVFLLIIGNYIGLFIIGFYLSMLRSNGHFDKSRSNFQVTTSGFIAILAIVVNQFSNGPIHRMSEFIAAVAICYTIYLSSHLKRFMSNSMSQWLGKISFPLYWIQFPVLVSFFSYGVISLHEVASFNFSSAVMLGIGTLMLCIAFARAGRYVEDGLMNKFKKIASKFFVKSINHA